MKWQRDEVTMQNLARVSDRKAMLLPLQPKCQFFNSQ